MVDVYLIFTNLTRGLIMLFIQRGNKYFYPLDSIATQFVEAFPSSSGKRKCLTLEQYELLKKIGAQPKMQEKPKEEETYGTPSGANGTI